MANKKHSDSVAGKIRAYMKQHPTARPSFIAKELGISPQAVYTVRHDEKKRKQTKKAKPTWVSTAFVTSNESIIKKLDAGANGTSVVDMVNHPPHYKVGGIETIDFIEAKKLNYNLGNVVKYVSRADHKSRRVEDLKKAKWYLEREIEKLIQVA